jgi:two-component system NarL family sensor kinase
VAPQVSCHLQGEEFVLPDEVKTVLFRVAQEGVANAAKHAHAAQVRLALRFERDGVTLSVEDDGRGFDLQAVQFDPHRGIGLRNMRERLASIDGQFEVTSVIGGGTRLQARISRAAVQRLTALHEPRDPQRDSGVP